MVFGLFRLSKLDVCSRLALLYVALKVLSVLRAATNPKHLLPRTSLELTVDPNPQAHAIFRHFLPSVDGTLWLYTKSWVPAAGVPWKAVLFLVHGFNDHVTRYEHVGRYLAAQGYAVFAMDHQGHGQSEGDRLYVERFSDYVADYTSFINHVLALEGGSATAAAMSVPAGVRVRDLPRFVLGHSMGAVVTVHTVQTAKVDWTGVILSGGALKVDPVTAPWYLRLAGRILSGIVPKLHIPDPGLPGLSRNPLVFERVQRDPLVFHGGLTPRWSSEFFAASDAAMAEAPRFTHDVVLFHGASDVIAMPEASAEFYAAAASTNKTLHMLPDAFHELLLEDNHEEMLATIVDWCGRQIERHAA